MSAIWGMVDFYKNIENEELAKSMEEPYHTYKIDIFDKIVTKEGFFGYGGQYFTREAREEKQPIVNEDFLFCADVVLDNREELINKLNIKQKEEMLPDGTLLYLVYQKYGRESLNMYLGTYAFSLYDKKKKEVLLAADPVGSRSLYYTYCQGRLYFSTLIKPILNARRNEFEWNYRYLTDYLALENLSHYTEAQETPYRNVYKVAPGQVVTITKEGVERQDYWKPSFQRKQNKSKEEDYKSEFITLFDQCVASVMRSSGKTGILLSGGLDSTSVACFAAPKLKSKGEMLYSYTSVPEKEYVSQEEPYYYTNEKRMVEITKNYLGNLNCSYLDLPGDNGFDGAEEYMQQYELPYKSLQNLRWLDQCTKKAAEDGCRIVLTGQFGNSTISYGNFDVHFNTLFRTGHFIELYREITSYSRKYRYGRKKLCYGLVKNFFRGMIRRKVTAETLFPNVYVNPDLMKQYHTRERILNSNFADDTDFYTLKDMRQSLLSKNILIQLGEFETHMSLVTGVLQRDPTKDRRMIEFCLKLPSNQFTYRGTERRLVKEYLAHYLPKEIIKETHKGVQSADMVQRIAKGWPRIYEESLSLLEADMAKELLDIHKIRSKLETYRKELPNSYRFEFMQLLYTILLLKYLDA